MNDRSLASPKPSIRQIEVEHVVVEHREIVEPVAVEVADDRLAEQAGADDFIRLDHEVVVEVEAPLAGVVQADLVAVVEVAVEVAGHGNRTGDVEVRRAAGCIVRMSVPSVTTPSLLVSMIQRKMPPSWAELP